MKTLTLYIRGRTQSIFVGDQRVALCDVKGKHLISLVDVFGVVNYIKCKNNNCGIGFISLMLDKV